MSAIASVTLLPKSALPAGREAATPKKSLLGRTKDAFHDVLAQHGRELDDYQWSGWVLSPLLVYLKQARGIDLIKSEFNELAGFLTTKRGASYIILTEEHKKWLVNLDATKFAEDELRDYYNKFNETKEPDAGRLSRTALQTPGVDVIPNKFGTSIPCALPKIDSPGISPELRELMRQRLGYDPSAFVSVRPAGSTPGPRGLGAFSTSGVYSSETASRLSRDSHLSLGRTPLRWTRGRGA